MNHSKYYPLFTTIIVSIGGLLIGLGLSSISGTLNFFPRSLGVDNQFLIGFTVTSITLGGIFGNMIAGSLSNKYGLKPVLIMSAAFLAVCAIGSALAPNIWILNFSRLFGGIGVGLALILVPMYISETAPSKQRGKLVTVFQLQLVGGVLLGYIVNLYILAVIPDPDYTWRWMLGIAVIPAILNLFLLFLIPESPRWLLSKNKDEKAKATLFKFGGQKHAESEYKQIKDSIENDKNKRKASLKELFVKNFSLILLIAFALAIFQQVSGINAIFSYAPMIFELAGSGQDGAFMSAIILGVVNVALTFVAMALIDRLGRRLLLIVGTAIITISLVLVGYTFKSANYEIKENKINGIVDHLWQDALRKKAVALDAKLYNLDKIQISDNVANVYKNGAIVKSFDITTAEMQSKKNELDVIKDVLVDMKGKSYRELEFFDALKEKLSKFISPKLMELKNAEGEAREMMAFSQLTKDLIKDNQGQFPDDESIVNNRFISYRTMLLNDSISINSMLVLIGIIGFLIGFAISLGPITWTMLGEIFPNHIRGIGISIAGTVNSIVAWGVPTLFPMEIASLGSAATFFIFAFVMFACFLFVIKFIPETKGKTLEEIESELVRN